jgi:hypothetical protein
MRSDAGFDLVGIKDFNLPLLDERVPPAMWQYSNAMFNQVIAWGGALRTLYGKRA